MKNYVEERENGFWIVGKRISLDSIIYLFNNGSSPESINKSFPLLSLEEIYGAITFYLSNKTKIDLYLTKEDEATQKFRTKINKTHSEWHKKMKTAKKNLVSA